MKVLSNAEVLKDYRHRAQYEEGGRVKRIVEPDPNAELKAIVTALNDLVQRIAQLTQSQNTSSEIQKRGVLELIHNQNQSISLALEAFAQRQITQPPCVFHVMKRDANGKVLEFTVKEI